MDGVDGEVVCFGKQLTPSYTQDVANSNHM